MQSSDSEDEIFFGPVVTDKEKKKINRLKGRKTVVLDPETVAAQLAGISGFKESDCLTQSEDVSPTQAAHGMEQRETQSCGSSATVPSLSKSCEFSPDQPKELLNFVETSHVASEQSNVDFVGDLQNPSSCATVEFGEERSAEDLYSDNMQDISVVNSSIGVPELRQVYIENVMHETDHLVCEKMVEESSVDLMSEGCHGLSPLKLARPSLGSAKLPQQQVAANYDTGLSAESLINATQAITLNESAQTCPNLVDGYSHEPTENCDQTLDDLAKQVDGVIDSQVNRVNIHNDATNECDTTSPTSLAIKNPSAVSITHCNVSVTNVSGSDIEIAAAHHSHVKADGAITTDATAMKITVNVEFHANNTANSLCDIDADCIKSNELPAPSEKSIYFSVDQEYTSTETEYFSGQCHPDANSSNLAVVSECHEASAAVGAASSAASASVSCSSVADATSGVLCSGATLSELPEASVGGPCNYNYLSDRFSIISIDEKDTDHSLPVVEKVIQDNTDAELDIAAPLNSPLEESPLNHDKGENLVGAENEDFMEISGVDEGFHDTGELCLTKSDHYKDECKLSVHTAVEREDLCSVTPPSSVGYKHVFSAATLSAAEIVTPPPSLPGIHKLVSKPDYSEIPMINAPCFGIDCSPAAIDSFIPEAVAGDQSVQSLTKSLYGENGNITVDSDSLSLSLLADVAIADEKRMIHDEGNAEHAAVTISNRRRLETASACNSQISLNPSAPNARPDLPETPNQNQHYISSKTTSHLLGAICPSVTPNMCLTTPGGSVLSPAREKFLAFAKELKEGKISDTSPFKTIVSVPGRSAIRNINKELDLLEECLPLSSEDSSVPNHFPDDQRDEELENLQCSDKLHEANAWSDVHANEVTITALDLEKEAKRVISSLDGQCTKPRESFFSALEVIDVHKPDIYGTFITDTERHEDEYRGVHDLEAAGASENKTDPSGNCTLSSDGMYNEVTDSSICDNSFDSQAQDHNLYSVNDDVMQFNDTLERMDYLLKASQEYNENLLKQQGNAGSSESKLDASDLDHRGTAVASASISGNTDDAADQTISDTGTSSSSDVAPANIAINEMSSSSDGNCSDVKHLDDGSMTSELSLLSFKKHSLNSQISISSFAPMLDSTHTSYVPRADDHIQSVPKNEGSKSAFHSTQQQKHVDKCSMSSSLEQRAVSYRSENLSIASSKNSSATSKTPAKPPRLAHAREVKPVAVVSPSLNASSERATERANFRQLSKNSDVITPRGKNTFKSPLSTPSSTPATRTFSSVSRAKQASASSGVSLATRTPVTNSASRLPVSHTQITLKTPCTGSGGVREVDSARVHLRTACSGKKLVTLHVNRLPPTPSSRGPRSVAVQSTLATSTRHLNTPSLPSTPQGPVARALLKNPPPTLFTNVKPKYSIGPHLDKEAGATSRKPPASTDASPQQPVDLNESMEQRSLALNRIQKTLDQLSAKSPGSDTTSPASGAGKCAARPLSASRMKTPLPHVQYKNAPSLLLGNKENVTPRRPCCKGKAEAAAAEPKLQVLKHSGRVLVPKNEAEGESVMEMSVHERRSIVHTNTIASSK